jgi:hypothetical protein
LLSNQKIGQIVSDTALKISQEIHKNTIATLGKFDERVVKVSSNVDIYNPEAKAVLLFDDGIQVKGQKAHDSQKLDQKRKASTKFISNQRVQLLVQILSSCKNILVDLNILLLLSLQMERIC